MQTIAHFSIWISRKNVLKINKLCNCSWLHNSNPCSNGTIQQRAHLDLIEIICNIQTTVRRLFSGMVSVHIISSTSETKINNNSALVLSSQVY